MTVLNATTDPSALSRTGRSMRDTVATLTGTAAGWDAFRAGAAAGNREVWTRTTPSSATAPIAITVRRLSLRRKDILLRG